jgi:hypothetical protein
LCLHVTVVRNKLFVECRPSRRSESVGRNTVGFPTTER